MVLQNFRVGDSNKTNSDVDFVRSELAFFLALCHGQNSRCIEAIRGEYLDFNCAFRAATTTGVPPDVKALFLDLIVGGFIVLLVQHAKLKRW